VNGKIQIDISFCPVKRICELEDRRNFPFLIFHFPFAIAWENISCDREPIASMTNEKFEMRNGKYPFLSSLI